MNFGNQNLFGPKMVRLRNKQVTKYPLFGGKESCKTALDRLQTQKSFSQKKCGSKTMPSDSNTRKEPEPVVVLSGYPPAALVFLLLRDIQPCLAAMFYCHKNV